MILRFFCQCLADFGKFFFNLGKGTGPIRPIEAHARSALL
jgi:hypothetical protein